MYIKQNVNTHKKLLHMIRCNAQGARDNKRLETKARVFNLNIHHSHNAKF